MTINEIKTLKTRLQELIENEITSFEGQTGTEITGLTLTTDTAVNADRTAIERAHLVEIKIEL